MCGSSFRDIIEKNDQLSQSMVNDDEMKNQLHVFSHPWSTPC